MSTRAFKDRGYHPLLRHFDIVNYDNELDLVALLHARCSLLRRLVAPRWG